MNSKQMSEKAINDAIFRDRSLDQEFHSIPNPHLINDPVLRQQASNSLGQWRVKRDASNKQYIADEMAAWRQENWETAITIIVAVLLSPVLCWGLYKLFILSLW